LHWIESNAAWIIPRSMITNPNIEDSFFMTLEEFLEGAERLPVSKKSSEEAAKDHMKLLTANAQRDDEWGLLANQVVGRETFK